MNRLWQAATRTTTWAFLLAIVFLSLVSPSLRPMTALPHNIEHAGIFALAGLAFGLGYPNHTLRNMIALTVFAGAIELAQLFAPGRHARWIDFAVDAFAACLGVALAAVVARFSILRATPQERKPGR